MNGRAPKWVVMALAWAVGTSSFAALEKEPTLTPEVETAIDAGLRYLLLLQKKAGHFGEPHPVGSTGVGLLAFLANGHLPLRGEYGVSVNKMVEYLIKVRDPYTGYLGSSMYEHAFATLALADVWGEYKDQKNELQEALEQALQLCVSAQNKEGGWRYSPNAHDSDISVVASVIQALRASREAFFAVPERVMDNAAQYVRRCQTKDGGFAYQGGPGPGMGAGSGQARTGAGVMSLMACGMYNSSQTLKGLEFLSRRPQLDQTWMSYSAYYSVLAMYQGRTLNPKFWSDWYPKIQTQLLRAQRRDGSFAFGGGAGSQGSVVDTGFALIALGIQKGYLPLFQR